jgi:hypothetical protein
VAIRILREQGSDKLDEAISYLKSASQDGAQTAARFWYGLVPAAGVPDGKRHVEQGKEL